MKKRIKPSKGRGVPSKSAKRKRVAVSKAGRKPKAATVKLKRKRASAKPKPTLAKPKRKRAPVKAKRKRAPVVVRPRAVAAQPKGPSEAATLRRIQALEQKLTAREHDRVELERWRHHHSQLQEQVKAKDSALAFKEKELLDLRRQLDELRAKLKKKEESA